MKGKHVKAASDALAPRGAAPPSTPAAGEAPSAVLHPIARPVTLDFTAMLGYNVTVHSADGRTLATGKFYGGLHLRV